MKTSANRRTTADSDLVALAAIFWLIAGLLAVFHIVPWLRTRTQDADDWMRDRAVSIEQDLLLSAADAFDTVGKGQVMVVIIVLVAVLLALKRRWLDLAFWATAMAVSQVLNGLLKIGFDRERPPMPLVDTGIYSFPSGHTLTTAAVTIACVLVFVKNPRRRRWWMAFAIALTIVMAASRVYLRAHWLTDVVFGFAIGAASALTVYIVLERKFAISAISRSATSVQVKAGIETESLHEDSVSAQ